MKIIPALVVGFALVSPLLAARAQAANFVTATPAAPLFGTWQIELSLDRPGGNPFFDVELTFVFTRPDGKEVKAEGFYRGGNTWAGRAYCAQPGAWKWRSVANRPALDGRRGVFEVTPSDLPGKLRLHPDDPRQFATDNGKWFLHVGDTAYRYVTGAPRGRTSSPWRIGTRWPAPSSSNTARGGIIRSSSMKTATASTSRRSTIAISSAG